MPTTLEPPDAVVPTRPQRVDSATRSRFDALVEAYGRFVPRELMAMLGKRDVIQVELGDHIEQRMTVLFSDIREFTRLSEAMSPQQNFAFINDYLRRMEPAIAQNGGIVDKYIGDAIMALFPSALSAVRSAVAMLGELERFNEELRARGGEELRIGIGVNTGVLMLGIIGAANRLESTVIADAVNVASRLEGETKAYGAPILISEHTLYELGDDHGFCVRYIDRTRVKGKQQPESLYEVFDCDGPEVRVAKIATLEIFEEAIAYYHLREVGRAKSLFEKCLAQNPADEPARVYLGRCEEFLRSGIHTGTGELDKVLKWIPEYAIGVTEIDEQHKALFDRIGKAAEAVKAADLETINDLLAFVDNYAKEHFETEEKVMESSGYPFAEDHIKEHRRFRRQFARLCQQINASIEKRLFLQFRVQLFLVDWIVNHTIKRDRHIGLWIRWQEGAQRIAQS